MRLRTTLPSVLASLATLLLSGCIGNRMYHPDPESYLRAIETPDGGVPVELSIIEFDDFGEHWDRAQADDVVDRIEQRNKEADGSLAVVIYVHGWQNSADPDRDENDLKRFEHSLWTVSGQLAAAKAEGREAPSHIIGVYIGWRGATTRVPLAKQLTFWNRQRAATRIAASPLRETFARIVSATNQDPRAVMLIRGHSLGGMIVAKTLDPVFTTIVLNSATAAVPVAADMIYLENPALEAILAKQQIDLLRRTGTRVELRSPDGTVRDGGPMIVAITSEADNVTKNAYAAGNIVNNAFRATRDDHADGEPKQWSFVVNAVGHMDYLVSHEAFIEDDVVKLRRIENAYNTTPFWVVRCTSDISANHGDINNDRMLELQRLIVNMHDIYNPNTQVWLVSDGIG